MLSNRDSYKRRVAKLEKQLSEQRERWAAQGLKHSRARVHYQAIVAKHIANERRGDQLLLEDRFKIQELENQVAVQWKNLAEAKDDAATAKLNYQVISKSLEQCRAERREARVDRDIALTRVDQWIDRCALAERSLSHRIWVAITTQIARLRVAIPLQISVWKSRIVNRFLIRRLSSDRVKALQEAGHVVPEKIIRSALAYYEHDKKRMQIDDQIKELHYGTRNGKDCCDAVIEKAPSLWRKLMILIGRA